MTARLAAVADPATIPDPIAGLHRLAEAVDLGRADVLRAEARGQLDRARDLAIGNLAELSEAADALDEIDPDAEPGEPLAQRIRRLAGTGRLRAVAP